jgi:hypothetical protein
VLLPNPCTTRPCLPGLTLAVDGPAGRHFLKRSKTWIADPEQLAAGLAAGDEVTVTGEGSSATDVDGQGFRTLTVESARRG